MVEFPVCVEEKLNDASPPLVVSVPEVAPFPITVKVTIVPSATGLPNRSVTVAVMVGSRLICAGKSALQFLVAAPEAEPSLPAASPPSLQTVTVICEVPA